MNGGFGLVLDGSERVDEIIKSALLWDVISGVARRSWARNEHSIETIEKFNEDYANRAHVTEPCIADDDLVKKAVAKLF